MKSDSRSDQDLALSSKTVRKRKSNGRMTDVMKKVKLISDVTREITYR